MLLCLPEMPYGYYIFVRVVAMGAFTLFAYYEYEKGSKLLAVIFLFAVIIFQPVIKIPLGRTLWNIVDIIMSIIIIISLIRHQNRS